MAEKITQRTIKTLITHERGTRIVWDSEIKGFGVRITEGGAVTFVLDYRVNGRQRRYKIGRHPEWTADAARAEAAELKPRIAKGYDPLEEREKSRREPTVEDLAADYMKRHAEVNKRASSIRNDQQMIDNIIKPRLGRLRVMAVGPRDIEALKASLRETPYRANRVLSLLSSMFAKSIEWKWRTENPVKGIQRYHEDRRERWLSEEEIEAFTTALDAYENQTAANALRLLLLTGARENEVLKAVWSQFDLKRAVWTKPSHHTKEKKTERIPLSNEALELLKAMNVPGAPGPLFPGKKKGTARVTIRRPWMQACKAAGLVETVQVQGKRRMLTRYKPTLRIHDLRHSYASHLVSRGTGLQIVGKLLGHTQVATTARYAHVADKAMRDATNIFGGVFAGGSKAEE